MDRSIVWFRSDLRLVDNPALQAAVQFGAVIPVFIWSPDEESPWRPGAASNFWLHQSLRALENSLRERGSKLILRRGPALETVRGLVKETGATKVFWNRRYEPAIIARDAKIKETLHSEGIAAESFNGALLHEPWTIRNKSDKPFQVFTPFWKRCLSGNDPDKPLSTPKQIQTPKKFPKSLALDDFELEPKIKWAERIRAAWTVGEAGAMENLKQFLSDGFENYFGQRNFPALRGTSRLSPYLHFGEISPRQIWQATKDFAENRGLKKSRWRDSQFVSEIGWREFAHHLLFHFPRTPEEPLRRGFERFPWRDDKKLLRAWQRGETGFPIVDAGMRELWATGWMHNRVRMMVASFLVKDLLLPWQSGARWFWDTLVDADLANNTLGWQWSAGCGADAAPYFRIFNPATQSEKFDANGDYIRHWCPELAKLPAKWIHQPHAASAEILRAADVQIGKNYPAPIVHHAFARDAALKAFAQIKS
ncbi:MAG TPA: deoxyribodipyrimidine photo-lyase [Verrucomicrobiae bacterium]|nr:deoxyribodipyrimidine photo-lyase [Verrucomicrobiae bacterium]